MAAFTIRKGTKDDGDGRFQTTQETWRVAYGHIFTPEEMEGVWAGRIAHHHPADRTRKDYLGTWVAEADDKIVGHIGLALLDDGRGEVAAFYVRPLYQGIGIGRRLWEAGLEALRAQGCAEADVWVLARGPAVTFYEKMGCLRIAEDVFRLGEHEEAIWGYRIAL